MSPTDIARAIDADEIMEIRDKMNRIGCASHTSVKFQDDLLKTIAESSPFGEAIIEIGCYKGGMTSQIAYAAKKLRLSFDVIDIDHHFLNVAAEAVAAVGLQDNVRFHAMDFAQFSALMHDKLKISLIFIDGDHRYDGVVSDCRAIKRFDVPPHAAVFHDFSLRYADGDLTDVRVDLAIKDEFGNQPRVKPIGELAGSPSSNLRTVPAEDRHYHESGTSEGVVLYFN